MSELAERLSARAALAGVVVPAALAPQLTAYYELLAHWNETINLTSLDDPNEAIDRLLLEPLAASCFLPSGSSLIDLGSGGGSPAIPLALASGSTRLVMVESRERKAAFLREAIRELGLSRTASVEMCRFEELSHRDGFNGAFGVVSVRAVRLDATSFQAIGRFLAPNGMAALLRSAAGELSVQLPQELAPARSESLLGHSTARLTLLRRL